jgi:hypothetical protein
MGHSQTALTIGFRVGYIDSGLCRFNERFVCCTQLTARGWGSQVRWTPTHADNTGGKHGVPLLHRHKLCHAYDDGEPIRRVALRVGRHGWLGVPEPISPKSR